MQASLSPAVRYSAVWLFGCSAVRYSGVPRAGCSAVSRRSTRPVGGHRFPAKQGCFATPAADFPANASQAAQEGFRLASTVRRAPYRAPAGAPSKGRQQPLPSKPRQVRVRAPAKRK